MKEELVEQVMRDAYLAGLKRAANTVVEETSLNLGMAKLLRMIQEYERGE